jgi:hypothetical protein
MTTIEDIKTELREIIQLSDNATPAPWVYQTTPYATYTYPASIVEKSKASGHNYLLETPKSYEAVIPCAKSEDATLIATSRNLMPKMAKALLTAIRVLEDMAQPLNCECSDEALRAYDQDSAIAKEALETIRREWEVQA